MKPVMAVSRKKALDYAEYILSRPRRDYHVTLKRGRTGATLLHDGRAITKCHKSRVGALQTAFLAQALGVEVPRVGESATVEVPSGVLYRAVAISSLDFRKPEARSVLVQLLSVAARLRSS